MDSSNAKMLIGQVSKEQVEAWKKEVIEKHGLKAKVFVYSVDGRVCYVRSVDRDLYSLATAKITSSPAKFSETIINNTWLGGDETIKNDDEYYFGLIDFVEEMMAKKKGTLSEA